MEHPSSSIPSGVNGNIDPASSPPFVLQCRKCSVIIGDSFSFQAADDELRAIILHTACNVSLQPNSLMTSKKGIDFGSTYLIVGCSECNAQVGRLYKTTARHLDHMRDMFSFDIDAIR
jgi:hypothetical protein